MSELLPCPHCGNDGSGPIEEALHIALNEHEWRAWTWTVQCDKCTATMGYFDSEDAAIEAWNTRALAVEPAPQSDADEREAIVEVVQGAVLINRYAAEAIADALLAAGCHMPRP